MREYNPYIISIEYVPFFPKNPSKLGKHMIKPGWSSKGLS